MRLRRRHPRREEGRSQLEIEQALERERRREERRRRWQRWRGRLFRPGRAGGATRAPSPDRPGRQAEPAPRAPSPDRPGRQAEPAPRAPSHDRLAVGARSVLVDVLGVARELVAWPVRVWLGIAEVVGGAVLWVWRRIVWPALLVVWRASVHALRWGEREVTPARGLCVVALAATVTLGAAQFRDYRAVEVGAAAYQQVAGVATAPEVGQESPRSAHGVSVFAIAVVSLFVTVFAAARNWRLSRLLLFLGAAVVLISLIVDAPQGVRAGSVALDYEGADAVLLGAFWTQLFSGVTLMVVGPLLAVHLRAERDARRVAGLPSGVAGRRPGPRRSRGMEEPAT
jgi:hypothetical protein